MATMPSNASHGFEQCYFLTFNTTKIDQVRNVYIVAATLDAILILPTIALNVLLIISLYRSSEIRKPSTKLLFSLALSDVLVGLMIEPTLLVKKIAELQHDFNTYCATGVITYVAGGALGCISFLTLSAIAVDRYLVVHKGTLYRTWVTNRRVTLLVVVIWVGACTMYSGHFYIARALYFTFAACIMAMFVVIASICYVKCFLTLRKQGQLIRELREGPEKEKVSNTYRYKKSMDTMCYVFLTFILCYLPYIGQSVVTAIIGESAAAWGAESITSIFIFANSLINPIILFWRMKEIRRAMTSTVSVLNASTQAIISPQKSNQMNQSFEVFGNNSEKIQNGNVCSNEVHPSYN